MCPCASTVGLNDSKEVRLLGELRSILQETKRDQKADAKKQRLQTILQTVSNVSFNSETSAMYSPICQIAQAIFQTSTSITLFTLYNTLYSNYVQAENANDSTRDYYSAMYGFSWAAIFTAMFSACSASVGVAGRASTIEYAEWSLYCSFVCEIAVIITLQTVTLNTSQGIPVRTWGCILSFILIFVSLVFILCRGWLWSLLRGHM